MPQASVTVRQNGPWPLAVYLGQSWLVFAWRLAWMYNLPHGDHLVRASAVAQPSKLPAVCQPAVQPGPQGPCPAQINLYI